MHGFLQSSEAWVSSAPTSLPLLLADAGFDVWLGNSRGNKYSCKHMRLSQDSDEYWDFSMDEVARYDVPAAVEHILHVTGQSSLSYIGFSQGSAVAFAALSTLPRLSARVNAFVALAPATTAKGFSNGILNNLTRSTPDIVFALLGRRALLPSTIFWHNLLSTRAYNAVIDASCRFLFGWDLANISPADKPLLYSHIYSFSSVKTVVHWFQIMSAGRFQMFHSWQKGTTPAATAYESFAVPSYPLDQIKCPVAIFYGGRDHLPDTEWLLKHVPEGTPSFCVDSFEHMDFIYAGSAQHLVWPRVIQLCREGADRAAAAATKPHLSR